MQYTIPAMVLLLTSSTVTPLQQDRASDLALAKTALDVVVHFVERGGVTELSTTLEACQTLWSMATLHESPC